VTITEALKILQRGPSEAEIYEVALVCGFVPVHLETFLAAHLQQRYSDRCVRVRTGTYGDVVGTLEGLKPAGAQAIAIVLEWQDLDSRLGYRGAGKWSPAAVADVLAVVSAMLGRMAEAIEAIPAGMRVVCCLPTLAPPPVFHTPGWMTAEAEVVLEHHALTFVERLLRRPGFALVNARRLAEESPAAERYSLKSDLATGLPYSQVHADAVASAVAMLIAPPVPRKGLITDLDDTLWHGLVGEAGPEGVSWDLASHQQLHGLYQKLLASLAEEGVLIGVASKNDPVIVEQALARADILLPPERVFPREVHWNRKSGSVERILRTWNVGADSVVFVDDSPMELAEVKAAHPGIECVQFPVGDATRGYAMLRRLRDLFGKPRLADEDAFRLESIRRGMAFQQDSGDSLGAEAFLQQADATVTFNFDPASTDPRTLELVNKTNQFNLNGVRYTETDWSRQLDRPGALLVSVSYQDRFGPLGKIAVLAGRLVGDTVHAEVWVMSCRAFSRRIEHQCIKTLFERSGAGKIAFAFQATPKNGPLQDFFAALTGKRPTAPFELARDQFEENRPPLYHRVAETASSSQPWIQSQIA